MALRVAQPSSSMMGRRAPQRRHYLMDSAVQPRTKDRYKKLVVQSIDWSADNDDDAHSAEDFDNLLADYIHYLYEHDAGKSRASHTLFGVLSFMPALANSVPISRRCIKGWEKLCPSVPWPPVTWPVVVAIGVRLTCNGSNRAGIGCLLAFDCLLRINELLGLYREDVVEAGDKRVGTEYKGVWLRLAPSRPATARPCKCSTPMSSSCCVSSSRPPRRRRSCSRSAPPPSVATSRLRALSSR